MLELEEKIQELESEIISLQNDLNHVQTPEEMTEIEERIRRVENQLIFARRELNSIYPV